MITRLRQIDTTPLTFHIKKHKSKYLLFALGVIYFNFFSSSKINNKVQWLKDGILKKRILLILIGGSVLVIYTVKSYSKKTYAINLKYLFIPKSLKIDDEIAKLSKTTIFPSLYQLEILFSNIQSPHTQKWTDDGIDSSYTQFKGLLKNLLDHIENKKPDFKGVPKNPEERKKFYSILESRLRFIAYKLNLLQEKQRKLKEDVLIRIAGVGMHCAGRWMTETINQILHLNIQNRFDLKENLLKMLALHRLNIVKGIAHKIQTKEKDYTHTLNGILLLIGKKKGIPGSYAVIDSAAVKFDKHEKMAILKKFNTEYSPKNILSYFRQIFKSNAEIRNLMIGWFKTNIPKEWRRKVEGVSKKLTFEEEKSFLFKEENTKKWTPLLNKKDSSKLLIHFQKQGLNITEDSLNRASSNIQKIKTLITYALKRARNTDYLSTITDQNFNLHTNTLVHFLVKHEILLNNLDRVPKSGIK